MVSDASKRALVRFSSSLDPVPERTLDGALARMGMIAYRAGGFWFSASILTDSVQGIELRTDTLGGAPLHRVVVTTGTSVQFGCVGIPQRAPLFSPGSPGRRAVHASS